MLDNTYLISFEWQHYVAQAKYPHSIIGDIQAGT